MYLVVCYYVGIRMNSSASSSSEKLKVNLGLELSFGEAESRLESNLGRVYL